MRVQITTRHCRIPDALRERADRGARSLQRFHPGVSAADVVFEEVGSLIRVEVVLSVDRSDRIVAHAEMDGSRRALDLALHRVRRILTRQRERARDHRAPPLGESLGAR